MKKNNKRSGKGRSINSHDVEEREFKIRALKTNRREKYKSKNQRLHQWVTKEMWPEEEDYSDYDHRA